MIGTGAVGVPALAGGATAGTAVVGGAVTGNIAVVTSSGGGGSHMPSASKRQSDLGEGSLIPDGLPRSAWC